ncbi:MAG: FAD-dependent thymidylate synthase [Candidatus Uhrbacteria bacterium]|nr:FAD-dependent thymidylate synthase [Patescibacteria group bacterium]MBU1907063.1 FAD-dependent thymidylate synthase [Patescibacteria group bacterium]
MSEENNQGDMGVNKPKLLYCDDRVCVFEDPDTLEKMVAYGDGAALPFRSFISETIFRQTEKFMVSPGSNVTALNSELLTGLMGAALARQSRAPGTVIDVIAEEFMDEQGELKRKKLDKLIERVLIKFGDDSVQELETATVLFNSISNLATKFIEDRRLGSYIEQSSRYVVYTERDQHSGKWLYYREPRIMESRLADKYTNVLDRCFELYAEMVDALTEYYRTLKPLDQVEYAVKPNDPAKYRLDQLDDEKQVKEFNRTYTFDLRTRACDTARVVLPAATLTNMAMVANGRVYEHLLKRMYSSNRPEFMDLAERLHSTLNEVIPKYVKRADPAGVQFWMEIDARLAKLVREELPEIWRPSTDADEIEWVDMPRLISDTHEARRHMCAAVLYPHARASYHRIIEVLDALPDERIEEILSIATGERTGRRDRSPRGFEHGYPITVDIAGNFGIFRDLHRHRMCTLQRQPLNPHVDMTVPEDIETIGYGDRVRSVAAEVAELYDELETEIGTDAAEYCVLFGHHIRFMFGMNLREAQHLLELRTVPQGHPDYRRVCQTIDKMIKARAPWIERMGILDYTDHNQYHWARADAEARQSQKTLEKGLEDIENES